MSFEVTRRLVIIFLILKSKSVILIKYQPEINYKVNIL